MSLILRAITLQVAGKTLLSLPALEILPGQTVTLMGPSGSGKSSLIAALAGLAEPEVQLQGYAEINGEPILSQNPESRRLGLLFQDALLFPHLSVAGNLAFGLPPGLSRQVRRQRVDAALAAMDLEGYGGRDPATLSGGQKARIALGRTLLAEPRLLLLDEPFAKLDASLRQTIRTEVFTQIEQHQLPALLVTHDPEDARQAKGPVYEIQSQRLRRID